MEQYSKEKKQANNYKLTVQQIKDLHADFDFGKYKTNELAEKYNVSGAGIRYHLRVYRNEKKRLELVQKHEQLQRKQKLELQLN